MCSSDLTCSYLRVWPCVMWHYHGPLWWCLWICTYYVAEAITRLSQADKLTSSNCLCTRLLTLLSTMLSHPELTEIKGLLSVSSLHLMAAFPGFRYSLFAHHCNCIFPEKYSKGFNWSRTITMQPPLPCQFLLVNCMEYHSLHSHTSVVEILFLEY